VEADQVERVLVAALGPWLLLLRQQLLLPHPWLLSFVQVLICFAVAVEPTPAEVVSML
jgi:hypothetical protein